MDVFNLKPKFEPAGDQPEAIKKLNEGLKKGMQRQTLLGATGTGKTFTMANIIAKQGKPTLVIAHNKTLAAQLAAEFREFFPDNAVHYFVSYYDFYQPEAYMPVTDTYIEKDASINKEIDRLRHASTQSLLTRSDVIIVASVSCIYGLGSPAEYEKVNLKLAMGQKITRTEILQKLIAIRFERTNADLTPGTFRALGTKVEIMPVSDSVVFSIDLAGNKVNRILKIDPVSSKILNEEESIYVFPAKHFVADEGQIERALKSIQAELKTQLKKFETTDGKLLEAERLRRRTNYDLAMIREVGYCSGIENYSRHMSGKKEGEAPDTLLSYFPHKSDGTADFLTIIDESHVTIPQLNAMYAGDQARKSTLVEFGFRLPSAKDNRPLKFAEFEERIGPVIFTSATPSNFERDNSEQIVEQIIRPTGLIDPSIEVKPILEEIGDSGNGTEKKSANNAHKYPGQVQDFILEAEKEIKKGGRVIATTLTKKMAEDLSAYLKERKIKSEYLHSDVKTLDRIKILTEFRRGNFDIIVGVNLLREGLDLPEVSMIGILDADKEGFLRSEVSLIQTIGRAARNVDGRVILYADNITGSMERAIGETTRRRNIQIAYNKKNKITPKTIEKRIHDIAESMDSAHDKAVRSELEMDLAVLGSIEAMENSKSGKRSSKSKKSKLHPLTELIKMKEDQMKESVKALDFETAAILRDELKILRNRLIEADK